MKIIITPAEKSALEKIVAYTGSNCICRLFVDGDVPCPDCPMDAFDVFQICSNGGSVPDMQGQAEGILAAAEVQEEGK